MGNFLTAYDYEELRGAAAAGTPRELAGAGERPLTPDDTPPPPPPPPRPSQPAAGTSAKDSSESQKPSEKPSEKPADAAAAGQVVYTVTGNDPPWPTDLCGLEALDNLPEGAVVRVWEGPQRIKTTPLNASDQKLFRDTLERIFHPDILLGKKIIFTPQEITKVIRAVIPLFESEPVLIEDVPFDVTIVGDIHGQLFDLHRVFAEYAKDGKRGWENMKFVFLGDYVDRGRQSIEVVMALFCIKCLHPDRIFLLRGNHEFWKINKKYGFLMDFRDRYEHMSCVKYLWQLFNEAFCWMSIAAIVGNHYFCAHGGISTSGFTRRQMRGIYKPIFLANQDTLIQDLTWSDPAGGLRGSAFNKDRGASIYFGYDEVCKALASMEVTAIFRGHSRIMEGYAVSWNVCYTIFTATNADQTENKGAIAYVNPVGRIQFIVFGLDPIRLLWERRLRSVEYNDGNAPDPGEKTIIDSDGLSGALKK